MIGMSLFGLGPCIYMFYSNIRKGLTTNESVLGRYENQTSTFEYLMNITTAYPSQIGW